MVLKGMHLLPRGADPASQLRLRDVVLRAERDDALVDVDLDSHTDNIYRYAIAGNPGVYSLLDAHAANTAMIAVTDDQRVRVLVSSPSTHTIGGDETNAS